MKAEAIAMHSSDSARNTPEGVSALTSRFGSRVKELAYGLYVWMLLLLIAAPACGVILILPDKLSRRRVARNAARLLFRYAGVQPKIHGLEMLPVAPHLLVVNHTSFVDAIVLTALLPVPPGYAFTAKQQFRVQSAFCPLLRALGTIVLHPHDAHHASNIELFATALARGKNLVIFPEGGFRPEPGIAAFHSGAFVAAAKVQVPVVVAALRGTRQALRLGTWLPRHTSIELEIGPLFMPDGDNADSITRLQHAARNAMLALTHEEDLTVQGGGV